MWRSPSMANLDTNNVDAVVEQIAVDGTRGEATMRLEVELGDRDTN
jgi:hypothetical protein